VPRVHRAWWVALVTFLVLIASAAFRSSTGVMILPIEEDLGWSRSVTSLAISVNLVVYGVTAPFAAAFMERFGVRRIAAAALALIALGSGLTAVMTASWQLVFLWGVLVGLGTGSTALVFGALIATLVLGLVNALKRQVSPPLTMLYAVVSGFMLGAVSYWYNQIALQSDYEGLVLQAVLATFTTFGVMLLLYGTGIVKVTNKFVKFLLVAMVSYFFIALASLVASFFGVGGGWGFYGVGTLGLLLCIFGESWRMSFGLLVTLVWLYLEFLRLFAIIASGRD